MQLVNHALSHWEYVCNYVCLHLLPEGVMKHAWARLFELESIVRDCPLGACWWAQFQGLLAGVKMLREMGEAPIYGRASFKGMASPSRRLASGTCSFPKNNRGWWEMPLLGVR